MTNNKLWLQRVVLKLNDLHLSGVDFHDVWGWIFDWDENLTITENFQNARCEELALTTLQQAGAIHTHHKENFLRDEHEESMSRHGWPMYSDWDKYPPSQRLYDFLWYIDGFDYKKFIKFCDTHGFTLRPALINSDANTMIVKDVTPQSIAKSHKVIPHVFEPKHYHDPTGRLAMSPTDTLHLTARDRVKRPDGTKYLTCTVMGKIFKSVNTIKNGVHFRTVLGVNDSKIDAKAEKKIRNAVAEINKKSAEVGGPKNLIKVQNKKVFLNNSYL